MHIKEQDKIISKDTTSITSRLSLLISNISPLLEHTANFKSELKELGRVEAEKRFKHWATKGLVANNKTTTFLKTKVRLMKS